jgi:hypothetical protein
MDAGDGADGAARSGGEDDGRKVAGLREEWPKTGPAACHVRSGIGAEERERLSSVGGSRTWPWPRMRECECECECECEVDDVCALVAVVAVVKCGGGVWEGREGREEVFVLGVLAREEEESIRRTAGAR